MSKLDTLLDELVTADRNWTRLEQSYLRMVKRVPKDVPLVSCPQWVRCTQATCRWFVRRRRNADP